MFKTIPFGSLTFPQKGYEKQTCCSERGKYRLKPNNFVPVCDSYADVLRHNPNIELLRSAIPSLKHEAIGPFQVLVNQLCLHLITSLL